MESFRIDRVVVGGGDSQWVHAVLGLGDRMRWIQQVT